MLCDCCCVTSIALPCKFQHSALVMQPPLCRIGAELGHRHFFTHCFVHAGEGFAQVGGHALAHSSYSMPPKHPTSSHLTSHFFEYLLSTFLQFPDSFTPTDDFAFDLNLHFRRSFLFSLRLYPSAMQSFNSLVHFWHRTLDDFLLCLAFIALIASCITKTTQTNFQRIFLSLRELVIFIFIFINFQMITQNT